jgi:hypothetical protein
MKNPINNFHDALNEWNNGELKNVANHYISAMIKQLQDEQIKRRIDYAIADREAEIDKALNYCARNGWMPDSSQYAIDIWHDSDEYATEQEERKGCDDSHADRERD